MGAKGSKLSKRIIGGRSVVNNNSKRLGCGQYPMAPRGYVPICVGVDNGNTRRFIVHTQALCDAEFLELLCKSAEEYGFCNDGVLRIPYEANDFQDWTIRRARLKITPI